MPKARAQRWHPRSLAAGKYREFKGDFAKPLKLRENPRSPGKPFLGPFPPFNSCHSPPEKVTSLQLLGVASGQKPCDVLQIPRMAGTLWLGTPFNCSDKR